MTGIARKSGQDTISTGHGCDTTTVTDVGSSTVLVNGYGVCRLGDSIKIHNINSGASCIPHTAYINSASSTVFANGIAIARKDDSADNGLITSGSTNVIIGK